MKRITIDDEGVESESKVFLIFKRSDIRCTRFYDDADPEIFGDEDITIEFKSENEESEWENMDSEDDWESNKQDELDSIMNDVADKLGELG